jgi:hypothetical protein
VPIRSASKAKRATDLPGVGRLGPEQPARGHLEVARGVDEHGRLAAELSGGATRQ